MTLCVFAQQGQKKMKNGIEESRGFQEKQACRIYFTVPGPLLPDVRKEPGLMSTLTSKSQVPTDKRPKGKSSKAAVKEK